MQFILCNLCNCYSRDIKMPDSNTFNLSWCATHLSIHLLFCADKRSNNVILSHQQVLPSSNCLSNPVEQIKKSAILFMLVTLTLCLTFSVGVKVKVNDSTAYTGTVYMLVLLCYLFDVSSVTMYRLWWLPYLVLSKTSQLKSSHNLPVWRHLWSSHLCYRLLF